MTAVEFWREECEREHRYITGNLKFTNLRSWTVAMFEIVMDFAEKYADYRVQVDRDGIRSHDDEILASRPEGAGDDSRLQEDHS